MHQALGGLRRISPSHPNAPGVRGTTRVRAASSQNPHLKDNHGKGFADVSLHKRHETDPSPVHVRAILFGVQVITLDRVFESEFVVAAGVAAAVNDDSHLPTQHEHWAQVVLSTIANSATASLSATPSPGVNSSSRGYEKKLREDSFWQPYIKELDRQRARGTQAVESPILWAEEELEELLTGSPLLATVRQRLAGIEHEYKELDTVWYMACSLFNRYPFDLPTETFSFERFKQAFAAVQASIVHLQGVPPSRRFALVPLGPPLLSYSSTSKALFTYNEASKCVELRVDQSYSPGDPVSAWCGPQPNTRLLLNYGLVDENNPYDKLQVSVILASTDPLYQLKRSRLQAVNLSTSQPFDLQRNKKLAPLLLPYLRLAAASSPEEVQQVVLSETAPPVAGDACEALLLAHLTEYFNARLAGYKHTMAEDMDIMISPRSSPRQKVMALAIPRHDVAARLTKIEKGILTSCLEQLQQLAAQSQVPLPIQLQGTLPHVKLV
ncbi:hypothetical protein QJQ45_007716 [Haematococcus lacustris]|nr:hypothetical protein QJQ45_007716 [Haematococcus lacustris]